MNGDENSGVEYLVSVAKAATKGTQVHIQALHSLGLAGGTIAQQYLISVAKTATNGTKVHIAALEALGRACRA
ncbi:hypothetical protein [Pseudomonas syringae group genomosp. 3]|uniref:hypothetical protein n=1 Tax=Pseudomonas syringae group genomosp. 3 TaxID=251701 RepID=UPI0011C3E044|nr:hypothetical protein [Pseudomonas syringae group genomosp. 3]